MVICFAQERPKSNAVGRYRVFFKSFTRNCSILHETIKYSPPLSPEGWRERTQLHNIMTSSETWLSCSNGYFNSLLQLVHELGPMSSSSQVNAVTGYRITLNFSFSIIVYWALQGAITFGLQSTHSRNVYSVLHCFLLVSLKPNK